MWSIEHTCSMCYPSPSVMLGLVMIKVLNDKLKAFYVVIFFSEFRLMLQT